MKDKFCIMYARLRVSDEQNVVRFCFQQQNVAHIFTTMQWIRLFFGLNALPVNNSI